VCCVRSIGSHHGFTPRAIRIRGQKARNLGVSNFLMVTSARLRCYERVLPPNGARVLDPEPRLFGNASAAQITNASSDRDDDR
jgi:hypothetical protein